MGKIIDKTFGVYYTIAYLYYVIKKIEIMTTLTIKRIGSETGTIEVSIRDFSNWLESNISGNNVAHEETSVFVENNIEVFENRIVSRNHSGTNLGLGFIDMDSLFDTMESNGYIF